MTHSPRPFHGAKIHPESSRSLKTIHVSVRPTTTTRSISSWYEDSQRILTSETTTSDQKGLTKDHHRSLGKKEKKNGWIQKCLPIVLATIIILGLVLAIVLPIVLIQSSKKTTSAKNVTLRWKTIGMTVAGTGFAGNGSQQLNQPYGVTWSLPKQLYVADYGNHRIQKLTIGDSIGTTVAGETNGPGGNTSDRLYHPSRVLVDSAGAMYIADTDNHRIQLWSNGATSGTTVAGSSAGIAANSASLFNHPMGLVLDETANVLYIADYHNDRLMKYIVGASSGTVVAGDNGFGWNLTQLYRPYGLYFDTPTNSFIIANSNAHNIVRWTLGASNWSLLAGSVNGVPGYQATLLSYPMDVTMDPMGNLYIADKNNHRIQFVTAESATATTIAGVMSTPGGNSTHLNGPRGIYLDNQLNLYVADTQNHRVQLFLRY